MCRAWMLGRRQPRLLLQQSSELRQLSGTGEFCVDVLCMRSIKLHIIYMPRDLYFVQTIFSARHVTTCNVMATAGCFTMTERISAVCFWVKGHGK